MRSSMFSALVVITIVALLPARAGAQTTAARSWDQKLSAESRFLLLPNWGHQAVLDRETGLVWERKPFCSDEAKGVCEDYVFHSQASSHCINRVVGNRQGWRLPSIQELLSLVDPAADGLPVGHPFIGFFGQEFQLGGVDWISSTPSYNSAGEKAGIYVARFRSTGTARAHVRTLSAFNLGNAWCVRSGEGSDVQ